MTTQTTLVDFTVITDHNQSFVLTFFVLFIHLPFSSLQTHLFFNEKTQEKKLQFIAVCVFLPSTCAIYESNNIIWYMCRFS